MKNPILAFDYDGLIVDTESTSFESWKMLYERYGCTLELETWYSAVGGAPGDRFDPCKDLARRVGRVQSSLLAEKYEIHIQLDETMDLRRGVLNVLSIAKAMNIKTGIVSNSPRWWIERGLTRRCIREYFEIVISREDVGLTKPDPEGYLRLLYELNGDSSRSIAFEDSEIGVVAAKRAMFTVVAVPNAMTMRGDFALANVLLSEMSEIEFSWLEKFLGK